MKKLLKKAQENCKAELSVYDDKGMHNTPTTFKTLVSTWKFIILFIIGSVLFAYSVNFGLPKDRILFAVQFLIGMQVASFLVLSLRIKDSYSVFMVMQYLSLFVLGSAFFALSFYSTATLKFPLVDDELIAIDKWFFFDWRDYMVFVRQYPALQTVLNIGYSSMILSIIIIIFSLVVSKNVVHLQRFAIAYFITLLATLILACIFPALAGYIHYNVEPVNLGINPSAARIHEADMLNLRAGELHNTPTKIKGLVTFPSFHSSTGLLLIWGFYPVIWLRLFMAVLNVILIVSTPFSGGHYLADVVGGLAVTMFAILIAHYLIPMKKKAKNELQAGK
jgi:membrane-associated phospholipid phosphatase